mmetsp:Transcript_26049/g.61180  ORF Transcript_26049/g.61180 Transcript_26049/m.61180 type:complete len:243 (-) Transcript_26049:585-1313(-)
MEGRRRRQRWDFRSLHRNRSGNDLLVRRRLEKRPGRYLRERTGQPHHPLLRRLSERRIVQRRSVGRRRRQESGLPKSHGYLLRRQAIDRAEFRRRDRAKRQEALSVRDHERQAGKTHRSSAEEHRFQVSQGGIHPGRNQRDDSAKNEGNRRGLPRDGGQACCCDRSGVLQRRAATGHERCRNHRRAEGRAGDQRADGGRHCVRARQARPGGKHIGLRSGWRNLRRYSSVHRQRRVRGSSHER